MYQVLRGLLKALGEDAGYKLVFVVDINVTVQDQLLVADNTWRVVLIQISVLELVDAQQTGESSICILEEHFCHVPVCRGEGPDQLEPPQ